MKVFQNYHRHAMYTNVRISDSAVTPKDYAERAKALRHGILSSAEHGWQGNYFETVRLAKEYGLKPLIGAEAYWVKDRTEKDRTNCHIFLGAKNERGRQALNDVLSEANLTGFYGQPRLDVPLLLSLPKDDLIVTTACIAYWRYENIEEITAMLAKHFGKNFFLEVQYHNTESQRELNKRILRLHNELKIPLIMGCDSHYIGADQGQTRTDFLVSKGLTYPDEEGWFLDYPDGDTAYERFANQCVLSHNEINDAMDNTGVFLEVEEYDSPIFNTDIKMPSLFPTLSQEEKNEKYKSLVWSGWEEYKTQVPEEKWALYESEIEKEIKTVEDTKMADYFIDNYHIIRKGKENGGWLTKSGRGSAVSFITNMLLGFTEVDRIAAKVHMYPERFMSATRILQSGSLPDIDFNCAPVEPFARAQQEILGEDHAYPMVAYGTMQKSAAWKLYAKSQGISFEIANAVSEQIKKYETAVKHAPEDEKDDINVFDYIDKDFHEIYEKSKDYLGLVTSWSIAPCSYLLYEGSIRKEIGLVKVKDHLCCLMDGHWAEACHFLKNDLLKVSVVDLIYRAYHRIGIEPPTVTELLKMCPPDDKAWEIYEKGCTLGINQCEQTGTASRVTKYKPKNISELGAFVAAIRPGFKSMYKTFEERKPFAYGVKAFDELIQTDEMPSSFLLYQEQEMAALNYAGIDMSDCYTAIKNIAKKRADKVLAYKEKFINGFSQVMIEDEHKTPEEAAHMSQELWQIIEDSSRYSFNASHSYCVALDSLYGAWLKAHHPLEFYEVLLTLAEQKGDKDKMNALKEEAESYFNIKFPPFRFGQDNRSIKADVENNLIVNSLSAIKGFSLSVGAALYDCSKNNFTSFVDVLAWLDEKALKASKVRPLITIDYFQQFGNINELLSILDLWELLKQGKAKSVRKDKVTSIVVQRILSYNCSTTNKDGTESASYRMENEQTTLKCLYDFEQYIKQHPMPSPSMKQQIQYSIDILGYADVVTNREEDRRRLLITDVVPLSSAGGEVWSYRVGTRSLGSGKTARLTVKANIYDKKPIKAGDIIYAADLYKNQTGYWYLIAYNKEA
jgi:DNA polymerase III alpha subunit